MSEGPPFFLLFAPVWLEVSPLTTVTLRGRRQSGIAAAEIGSTRQREEEAICRWISLLLLPSHSTVFGALPEEAFYHRQNDERTGLQSNTQLEGEQRAGHRSACPLASTVVAVIHVVIPDELPPPAAPSRSENPFSLIESGWLAICNGLF